MLRWMCDVKVKDRVPSRVERERLGLDDIVLALQQNRLQWYGHVLQKEDSDWLKMICVNHSDVKYFPSDFQAHGLIRAN